MKKFYLIISIALINFNMYSQNYEFGLIHVSNYDFKVVAIPDFASGGNTDVSDVGFTLVLPAGVSDLINETSLLSGRTWNVSQFDAAFLTNQGLGDGSKDVFQFNMPPGQSILSHTNGQQIDLVSFQVSDMPTSSEMYFLLNSDPIATGAVGVLDSFYNSDIDGPGTGVGTIDYFSGIAPELDSFSFSTLSTEDSTVLESDISIYPNPTSEFITISSAISINKVELYDLLGKKVFYTSETSQIKISQLPVGVYLVKIYSVKGVLSKKIMIE